MILTKLKDLATVHFGKKVTKAVITVPAHFNDAQRQATKNAGRIAGLDVVKIINEPTAAALAYGIDKKYKDKEPIILVYDFGGGTFDVSVICMRDGVFEVKATNGIYRLGGDDIDMIFVKYCCKEFEKQFNLDMTKDIKAMRRLRAQCEKVKEMLSLTRETTIEIEALYQGKDFECKITRQQLDESCKTLFLKSIDCVEQCLNSANITKDQVDEILLVGGSTRIPRIRECLQEYFNKEPNAVLNPDEAVAMGAAIEAAILDGEQSNTIKEMLLLDVCPLSLGVQTKGGIMNVIIPRNTQIPVEKTKNYQTTKDNQTFAKIVVYEGESVLVERNMKLGEFTVNGIEEAPKGQVKFDVNFKIDSDGILEVTAVGFNNEVEGSLQVTSYKGHLTEAEINEMIKKAEIFRVEDDKKKALVKARVELHRLCYDIETKLGEADLKKKEKKSISEKLGKVKDWMLKFGKRTEHDYKKKIKELESLYKLLTKKM